MDSDHQGTENDNNFAFESIRGGKNQSPDPPITVRQQVDLVLGALAGEE